MRWVTEISPLTYSLDGSLEGGIPLTQITGETADISEYLNFGFYGFYDQVWYNDNAGTASIAS